jgi:hypothetical protein
MPQYHFQTIGELLPTSDLPQARSKQPFTEMIDGRVKVDAQNYNWAQLHLSNCDTTTEDLSLLRVTGVTFLLDATRPKFGPLP